MLANETKSMPLLFQTNYTLVVRLGFILSMHASHFVSFGVTIQPLVHCAP